MTTTSRRWRRTGGEQINQWRSRNCLAYETHPTLIKPQQVIETLQGDQGEAFVASDVGQHQMFAAPTRLPKPRQWINSGGLGTMGFGIPAAMGPSLPTRKPWSAASPATARCR